MLSKQMQLVRDQTWCCYRLRYIVWMKSARNQEVSHIAPLSPIQLIMDNQHWALDLLRAHDFRYLQSVSW